MHKAFSALYACHKPVISETYFGLFGVGSASTFACDMRNKTETTIWLIFETILSITTHIGAFLRLVNLVPEGMVREMAYTGRWLTAVQAQAMGLLNKV